MKGYCMTSSQPSKIKHQIPPTSGINLEYYAMDNFCRAHYANHSKKICPEFINLFKEMILPRECQDAEEEQEEEEEEEEPPSNLHLIWDDTELDDIDDDIMEEACVGNDYNIWSRDAPQINDFPSTSKSESLENIKDMRRNFVTSQSTTNIDFNTNDLEDLKLDYSVVEDLKKMKENITVFELCKITQLREQLREVLQHIQAPQDVLVGNSKVTPKGKSIKATKTFKALSVTNTSNVEDKERTTMDERKPNPRVYGMLIGRKSRSQTSPFLLTFEIFNRNVHNCLVDSGASSNVMPYSVCKKLNVEPQMSNTKIIQLDRSHVKVFGELKDVLIRLSSNSKVHQTIHKIVVDLPETYGVILIRDWLAKMNGYFATDWSHLWLPYKGQPNKIKVDQENYMKHTVTDLNDPNEMVMFSKSNLGNFCFDTFFE
jgi:hypothetical protein